MKATKTFNIGECALGGVITVEIQGKVITVIGKDWDFSAGSSKNSDQSNAEEFIRGTVLSTEPNAKRKLMDFLEYLTTYYYAQEICKWVESKTTLEPEVWVSIY
jgi:hypothetical protein